MTTYAETPCWGSCTAPPSLQHLLPFVRMFYGRQSTYLWTDDAGATHRVLQGEGGEQGDPLMPALYSLGQHEGLAEGAAQLQDGDFVVAISWWHFPTTCT